MYRRIRWSSEEDRMGFLADILIRLVDAKGPTIRIATSDLHLLLMMVDFYRLGITPEEAAESDAIDEAKDLAWRGDIS